MNYPKYATYNQLGLRPSVLDQEYPRPLLQSNESYFPVNSLLATHFSTENEFQKFGGACFCGFLYDTIEVEHCLVIPAIASLNRIPYEIPPEPKQDLYKTATDEGHHAEQALIFLHDLKRFFGLRRSEEFQAPLFLRRLELQRFNEPNPIYKFLITVLNGIVTETRISKELSLFAADETLATPVRDVCRTHAQDESIHASQFQALGRWLWEEFASDTKFAASKFLTASTIARSLPDVDRIVNMLYQSTSRTILDCERLIYSVYNEEIVINEMLFAARPTISFMSRLGVEEYVPFAEALEKEREQISVEFSNRLKKIK